MALEAYSEVSDLRHGDIPLQAQHGTGEGFVQDAADDIDAQVGHIYVTPISVVNIPANRPTRLLLKKINNLLASGRLLLDMAAAAEDDNLHSYGLQMLKEGMELLRRVSTGEIVLAGAPKLDGTSDAPERLSIVNEDAYSMVEGFYRRTQRGELIFNMMPYDVEKTP